MNAGGVDESLVSFGTDGSTLYVRDELEGVRQIIEADSRISLQPALEEMFYVPVDDAVSFTAGELTIGPHGSVLLRDETGDVITEAPGEPYRAPRGTYYLEINGGVKTYLRVADTAVTLAYTGDSQYNGPVRVSLDPDATITVGARSQHERPKATVTVPDDPATRMEAFSYLGSSIKEFSPERSWPTLRGHPPRFERGSELNIPASLSTPDTGVTVTVPENHADLYRVAPLAYYLGASIEPAETAELHLPIGYSEPLVTADRSLEESVERIVSKCFLLDTLARQDGYTPIPIRAYADVAPHLPFYPEAIATEPLGEQLLEYLEAPDTNVFEALPRWPVAAVLRPDPADVPLVPHILNSMGYISVVESAAELPPAAIRDRPSAPLAVGYSHADVPPGGVALSETAYDHRLAETVAVDDTAVVAIVTDDPDRANLLRSHLKFAPLAEIPERIDVHLAPTVEELREVISAESDLLILDLPVTDGADPNASRRGGPVVDCADGRLDLSTIAPFRPRALVIDRSRSTASATTDVVEAGATVALAAPGVTDPDPGLTILGCLLAGCSLVNTAGLLFDGEEYRVAGVPTASAVYRNDGHTAECYIVESVAPDEFVVHFATSSSELGIGGVARNAEEFSHGDYQLLGTASRMPMHISTERVVDLLGEEDVIVLLNGTVYANEDPPSAGLVERAIRSARESESRDMGRTAEAETDETDALGGWFGN